MKKFSSAAKWRAISGLAEEPISDFAMDRYGFAFAKNSASLYSSLARDFRPILS
jgi:hypothetical protein